MRRLSLSTHLSLNTPLHLSPQVITAVLTAFQSNGGVLPHGSAAPAESLSTRYILAVAEEDGTTADPDFPEVRERVNAKDTEFVVKK